MKTVTELEVGEFYRHPGVASIGDAVHRYQRTKTGLGLMENAKGELTDWHLKVKPQPADATDIFIWVLLHEPVG